MASIMRTSKHEDMDEFKKWAKKKKSEAANPRKDKIKKLLAVEGDDKGGEDEEEEKAEGEGEEETKSPEEEGEKKEGPPEVDESVDSRVFICMGKTVDG